MADFALKAIQIASRLIEDRIREQVLFDLKHSDVTGQHFRDFIMKQLEEFKEKLDGLARVDLLASLNFFKDGITLLGGHLERVSSQKSEEHDDGNDKVSINLTRGLVALGVGITPEQTAIAARTVEAGESGDNSFIAEAKDKFDKSVECAVKAISNDALKIADRVFAARLRIIGTILKHIDDAPIALTLCKSYVKQLNSEPEVLSNASVHFGKGARVSFRKMLYYEERNALIWSVVSINRLLWNYAHICEVDDMFYSDWPLFELDADNQIHPVLDAAVRNIYHWLLDDSEKESKLASPEGVAVADNGHFVVADTSNECVKIFSTGGDYMYSLNPSNQAPERPPSEINQADNSSKLIFKPRCVAALKELSIFVGSSRGRREDDPMPAGVFFFNSDGNLEKTFGEENLSDSSILTSMVIDEVHDRLLISDDYAHCIHVFTLEGEYQSKIGEWEDHDEYSHLAVTHNGHILVTHWDHVRIYDSDGQFASKCKTNYGIPIGGIAYDTPRKQVYVLCKAYKHFDKGSKPNLLVYNKEWDEQGMIELPKSYRSSKGIAVTPTGFAAVVNVDDNEVIVI